MTYVISDLHGQYEAFRAMLNSISFSDDDTLYILGDIIDRGNQPLEIYEYIVSAPNIHMLMGNHEKMFLDYAHNLNNDILNRTFKWSRLAREYFRQWQANGGTVTYEALLLKDEQYVTKFIEYIESLPYYFKIEVNEQKFLLCHSKPIAYESDSLDDLLRMNIEDDSILWNRDLNEDVVDEDYIIIHGHTPVKEIVLYAEGSCVDIDCGSYRTGRLGCLCLDNGDVWYVDEK